MVTNNNKEKVEWLLSQLRLYELHEDYYKDYYRTTDDYYKAEMNYYKSLEICHEIVEEIREILNPYLYRGHKLYYVQETTLAEYEYCNEQKKCYDDSMHMFDHSKQSYNHLTIKRLRELYLENKDLILKIIYNK